MNNTKKHSVTPPSNEMSFKPSRSKLHQRIIVALILTGLIIWPSVTLSPLFLILIIGVIALFMQNYQWLKNGSFTMTKTGIIVKGASGAVTHDFSFSDVYKVVIGDPIVTLAYRNSSSAFGINFTDSKGVVLFRMWTFDFARKDIEAVFKEFKKEDTVQYGRVTVAQIRKDIIEMASK